MKSLQTERNRHVITGAIGMILLVAAITIGIKASFGAFDGGYHVRGEFAAAGQGLLAGSDVKIRGVNVGEVSKIELVDNQAMITMRLEDATEVPRAAQAVIRPKTLFGEKFIDIIPGDSELSGPYLADGDVIEDTLGGFELERVLSDAYPVLQAIDGEELAVILSELATAGDGLGDNINRSIVNGATLARLQASNDAEIRQFLGDLALLSEEIDSFAPTLLDAARDLNVALPPLNARSDDLNAALTQTARLSSDVADLLEANEEFTTNALTNGSKTLQVLFDKRSQIQPLLLGVTQYTQILSEAIRIEVGDGTLMAAVKNLISPSELLSGLGLPIALPAAAPTAAAAPPTAPPAAPVDNPVEDLLTETTDSIFSLLLGGARG